MSHIKEGPIIRLIFRTCAFIMQLLSLSRLYERKEVEDGGGLHLICGFGQLCSSPKVCKHRGLSPEGQWASGTPEVKQTLPASSQSSMAGASHPS